MTNKIKYLSLIILIIFLITFLGSCRQKPTKEYEKYKQKRTQVSELLKLKEKEGLDVGKARELIYYAIQAATQWKDFDKGIKFVEPSDLSGSLKGRQNLYNHLDMMVNDAEKTITIVTTAEGINRKLEALMPSLEKCKKRGVKVRIAAPIDNNNKKVAKELKKVAEVKNLEKIKARFMIIDSTQLMFMLLDDEKFHPNYDVGIWINTQFFAQALEQMFELAWKDMKAVK